ncbi:unnamed protein product [Paramecium octaurelia]|uniref:Uncharacterized protein n=1 Tax=Paramecium octaurelia TaxID=43137 RepID=A0A8S1SX65_PAROT|nr:unnamed protein product [Paramecium octaurelia]
MNLIKNKNSTQQKPSLSFIKQLFNKKKLEVVATNVFYTSKEEYGEETRKQLVSPRERLITREKQSSRQNTLRSHSSLQINDLIECNQIKQKAQIRLNSPYKFSRAKALQLLRDRQKSPCLIVKQRTLPVYSVTAVQTSRLRYE